jgi:phospholipase C
MRRLLRASTALVTAATMLNPVAFSAAWANGQPASQSTTLTLATQGGTEGAQQAINPSAQEKLSLRKKVELLRQKVKYVFVLFQENRSFDHYFGTYPGANGLFATYPGASSSDPYSQPANTQSSFKSVIQDTDGSFKTISPFLIPRTIKNANGDTVQLYPEDTFSVDHSHAGYLNDFHADKATKSQPLNDGYPLNEEGLHYATDQSGPSASIVGSNNTAPTTNPTLASKQKGQVVISHIDCDTIPFLWQYADRFVLFDNFHQTATGPSTPNAIAMIAGQVGDTQWVKHPDQAASTVTPSLSIPNLNDNGPFPGSTLDKSPVKPPYGPDEAKNPNTDPSFASDPTFVQVPLTFASLPLSFMGQQASTITQSDQNPTTDLADVENDIKTITAKNPSVNWGWYQQGYGPEPFDGQPINENGVTLPSGVAGYHYTGAPEHASYIVHHNGPQYFGYVGDNPEELQHLHGLQQFYTDVSNQALPANGGVFYVRGGYYNNDGLLPADPNPNVKAATPGNDDHPNYADAQIAESLIADSVNAIANSPYWKDSAIIITYDETDGLYDHQPERFRTYGPDGQPETGGPRIPAIVISPYAAAHTVSHVYSEHGSVIKFLDEVFGMTPLGKLPDEAAAREAGATNPAFNGPSGPQQNLGPSDSVDGMGDLLEAFDNNRLTGAAETLPASYAMIDTAKVKSLPHYASSDANGNPTYGCQALGITPTDYPNGYATGAEFDPPPQDFNPRPTQSPGNPYLNTNNNTGGASTGPWPY